MTNQSNAGAYATTTEGLCMDDKCPRTIEGFCKHDTSTAEVRLAERAVAAVEARKELPSMHVAAAVAAENEAHQQDRDALLRGLTDLARAWDNAASELSGAAKSRLRARSESFRQAHRLATAYLKDDPTAAASVLDDLTPHA